MEERTETALKQALSYLEAANPSMAIEVLSPLFEYEFDCPPLIFTSGCCNFWARKMRFLESVSESFERGELLLSDWKVFMQEFVPSRDEPRYMPTLLAARRCVFAKALQNYEESGATVALDAKADGVSGVVLRRAALCCKKLGFYDKALAYLAKAREAEVHGGAGMTSAEGTAELADCYALCGGDRNAKLLFREAFFIAPDEIDLEMLDSELIRVLIDKTRTLGYEGHLLQRWIPVWGTLWGVFCIKRPIKAGEANKIRQEIFSLENEMGSGSGDKAGMTPRLLNLYFWYIDYLCNGRGKDALSHKQINDVLLKIKILDKRVYEVYIK